MAAWFEELVPDLDFAEADPQTIEAAVDEAMAPSDWTALRCFPLTDDGLALTGEAIGVSCALQWGHGKDSGQILTQGQLRVADGSSVCVMAL